MEAHPVGSRWAMKARERGAKIIHVDPHYSRTSAMADLYVPIRAGSDIAFLGGLIRHIIETESYFKDYVLNYTNASTIVNEDFRDTEELEGLFSGFDSDAGSYDQQSWAYENVPLGATAPQEEQTAQSFETRTGAGMPVEQIHRDETLQDPRCVFQLVRKHYARYTPEMVQQICGVSPEDFLELANALIENSGRERTSMLIYAVGWTQHAAGAQMIRAGTIVQLLLGNVGRPGGGIMAMRGHTSIPASAERGLPRTCTSRSARAPTSRSTAA